MARQHNIKQKQHAQYNMLIKQEKHTKQDKQNRNVNITQQALTKPTQHIIIVVNIIQLIIIKTQHTK